MVILKAKFSSMLKAIKKAGKRKPKWNLEKLKNKENHMKEVIEHKFSQIDGVTSSVEDNWGKLKEILLDILNNDIGKMEIAPRIPWITQAMI